MYFDGILANAAISGGYADFTKITFRLHRLDPRHWGIRAAGAAEGLFLRLAASFILKEIEFYLQF